MRGEIGGDRRSERDISRFERREGIDPRSPNPQVEGIYCVRRNWGLQLDRLRAETY